MTPLVTVVLANHNYGHWLLDAIDSAAHQDYPNKQIVVVDDGSTDGSAERVLSHMENPTNDDWSGDNGFRGLVKDTAVPITLLHYSKASGPSSARNQAFRVAWNETDYFAILDADDSFKPGKLSKSVAKLQDDPENIGAVYSDYDVLNEANGTLLREFKFPFDRAHLLRECIVHSASVINKKGLALVGGYDEILRCCEDFDLWLRLSERMIICHIPESLMVVRVGTHDSSHTVKKATWEDNYRRVMEKARARANHGR